MNEEAIETEMFDDTIACNNPFPEVDGTIDLNDPVQWTKLQAFAIRHFQMDKPLVKVIATPEKLRFYF